MAKQLNISLGFSADTSKAKAQIQDLQKSLDHLVQSGGSSSNLPITKDLIEARTAAKQLSSALSAAFNADTGKLDLAKFNQSLKMSKMSLQDYANKLTLLGKEGDQAFLKIAQSIITTEAPLKRSSKMLSEFAVTLKNTARWQISSSILHGFMGSLQHAYGYAKDLNKSLNDIRIVTGYDVDHMKDFAVEANKAAKALSATTTEYTKASLIYYQQGLSDSEVQDRTDITIKMAHAAGQSAQIVSDQLTAVWNNFYDGSQSLEHYADVMTALGAATASSTDEIAGGLEKFASVADMIGLSYEYAASALATITAQTRQSEDVVGTALKTIFARIQGLKQGDTLDDGTDLNKYSEALQKVGINIFNASGQLKDMDSILDSLGKKWATLGKDQQVALAQTVAGTRQYNQLVSLMDNWDFFEENLATAQNSSGALQEQADIYAESWEAARDRVKASAEAIYGALLDDSFFISLNDLLASLLGGVKSLSDSLGGLKGVLFTIGAVASSIFKEQIATGINNTISNLTILTGGAQKELEKMRQEALSVAQAMTEGLQDAPGSAAVKESLTQLADLQAKILEQIKSMSPEQRAVAEANFKEAQSYHEIAVEAGKAAEAEKKRYDELALAYDKLYGRRANNTMQRNMANANLQSGGELQATATSMIEMGRQMPGLDSGKDSVVQQALAAQKDYSKALKNPATTTEEFEKKVNNLRIALKSLAIAFSENSQNFSKYEGLLSTKAESIVQVQDQFKNLKTSIEAVDKNDGQGLIKIAHQIVQLGKDAQNNQAPIKNLSKLTEQLGNSSGRESQLGSKNLRVQIQAAKELIKIFEQLTFSAEDASKKIQEIAKSGLNLGPINEQTRETMEALADAAYHVEESNQNYEKSAGNAAEATKKAVLALRDQGLAYKSVGAAIQGTLQGISSFGMALSSISSLMKTLQNDDLSGFEKAVQLIVSINFIIPGLVTGVTSLGNAIAFATSATQDGLGAKLALAMGVKAENALIIKKVTLLNGETLTLKNNTMAELQAAAAQEGSTVSYKVNTAAIWENTKAKIMNHIAAIALIGVITATVAALVVADKLYNKDTAEAKEAGDAAKRAGEEFKKAQDAYSSFKNNLKGYQNEIEGLKGLTKGTTEYREALLKANDAALKLIESGNLSRANGDYTVKDDLITISDEALAKVQSEKLSEMEAAQGYQAFTKQKAKNANLEVEKTNFNKKYAKDWGVSNTLGAETLGIGGAAVGSIATGALVGKIVGGAIGSIGGPMGTAIGTAIGSAAASYLVAELGSKADENKETVTEEKALQDLTKAFQEQGEALFEDLGGFLKEKGYSDALISSLTANAKETKELVRALAENIKAVQFATEQFSKLSNRDNAEYQNLSKDDQNLADKIIARNKASILADKDSPEYQAALREAKQKTSDDFNTNNGRDYLEAKYGKEEAKNYKFEDTGGGNVTLLKKTEDETWERSGEKNSYNKGFIDEFWAEKALTQYDDNVSEEISEINTVGNFLGNSTSIGSEKASIIKESLASGETMDVSVFSPEEVEQLKEQLASISTEAAENYPEDLRKALEERGGELSEALSGYNEKAYYERQDREADSIIKRGATDLDMNPEALEAYTQELLKNNEALKGNKKAAAEAAVASAKFSINLDKLEKTLKDNEKTLKKADKTSLDYYEAVGAIQSALKETFGLDISADLITKYFDEIKEAASGDSEAIEKLRDLLSDEIILDIKNVDNVSELSNYIQTLLDNVKTKISEFNNDSSIQIGATIDNASFLRNAQGLINSTKMTVDEAQSYFNTLGYEPEFEMENVKVTAPMYGERVFTDNPQIGTVPDGMGGNYSYIKSMETRKEQFYIDDAEQNIVRPKLYNGSPKVIGIKKKETHLPLKSTKAQKKSGGGGGSKAKPLGKYTKKKDVVKRYKEIDDSLDDVADLLSDVNKQADRLYGADRLKAMEKSNKILKQEIGLLKDKKKQAESNLVEDQKALKTIGAKNGVNFEFDKNNNISNYTTEMTRLFDEKHSAELAADADKKVTEKEKEKIEAIQKRIDAVKEALDYYENSKELIEDLDNEIQDHLNEIQDKNFEILNYKLELKIEINDSALEEIDYLLNKLSDDFYKTSEALSFMSGQKDFYEDNITAIKDFGNATEAAYAVSNISQAQYIEGLKKVKAELLSQLESLNAYDKAMLEYYGNTLEKADSELQKYTSHMEHLTEVLDHYTNLMNILGKQKDYTTMGNFLSGKAKMTQDQLRVAEANYNMLEKQKNEIFAKLNATDKEDAAYKVYQKQWEAIVAKTDEAQSQVLTLTENWAEQMKAVIENNLESAADSLEKTLTDGLTFDSMITEMDRLNQREEEYLTETNKIYETNKLIRTANQQMDKTSNSVAKDRLKEFAEQTKSLQEHGKLSKYELEIQQAKYDLLLAELALEDQKNAKTSMRLMRNDQGNYDYVYTADADKISKAQQDLDDAQNRLYNISLEGQQQYTDKYIQASKEMYDQLKALQLERLEDSTMTDEEYNQKKENILNHYFGPDGILTTYSKLYKVAVNTDSDAVKDNWLSNYSDMIEKTEEWEKKVAEDYLPVVESEYETWEQVATSANEKVESALTNSATTTEKLTEESEELADLIENDVLDAIEAEIDMVREQTNAYANQRAGLLALIATTEEYYRLISRKINTASEVADDYSRLMVEAYKAGDMDRVAELAEKRQIKEDSGDYTSVTTSKVQEIIDRAHSGEQKAIDFIDEVLKGNKKFTADQIKAAGFDTGGYTGSWGSEGRIAMLHEKELVLNKEDTRNILSAVDAIRSIGPNVFNHIKEFLNNNVLKNLLLNVSAPGVVKDNFEDKKIEQNVTIQADFPNVSTANEIEEAFNNLLNDTIQYINIH